ncbi:alpha/beta fold hydrolase [Acidovorax sp. Leaf78]|uniref:alpha/beta fold hydrolase n=1 Tax=unclassified Acidovorax TaxID=2684926 RepID=UPI0006F63FF1|nr:alpha/beta hydrolase [Acidovorax sp. Leaf78]KQO23113.1 hypothetical protein ASF16_24510 [Acidovorax sp. Leaf78]
MVTVVLLPGMDGTGDLFAPFVAALGPSIRTVVVRYPTQSALGYQALEVVARQALPQDGPYVLLGESFSGPIALSLAASCPPGLAGVVLCATFATNPVPLLHPVSALAAITPFELAPAWLVRKLLMGRHTSPDLGRLLRATLAKVSGAALRARAGALLRVNVVAQLRAVQVPVLYLQATEDRLIKRASAEVIKRALPNVEIVRIEAPHLLLQVAHTAAATAVAAFSARAEAGWRSAAEPAARPVGTA